MLLLLIFNFVCIIGFGQKNIIFILTDDQGFNQLGCYGKTYYATFSLWTASALLTYFFPIINKAIGASGSFWVFSAICFFGAIFCWRKLIETKGKSLEEVEKEFSKQETTN